MGMLERRDFLKILGLAGTSAALGCSSNNPPHRIPFLTPPEDLLPGEAAWYASTCRECPAGCGLLAKNREGRVIKVEGNPLHPVSRGKLCARGQAALQGLYNPDRFTGPLLRKGPGPWRPVTWEQGEETLTRALADLVRKGRGERIVLISELLTGSLQDLAALWLSALGSRELLLYESFAYEPLRRANRVVFQLDGFPHYRIDQADFLISLGAGFLETWISNLEFARQFAAFHALQARGRKPFVYVGPRLSLTANNADQWLAVAPGDEYLIGLGLLRVLHDEGGLEQLPAEQQAVLALALEGFTLEGISQRTGVRASTIRDLARRFSRAERPLVLAEGQGLSGPRAFEAALAANLLCLVKPGTRQTLDFHSPRALAQAAPLARMKALTESMKRGEVDLLLLGQVNPAFTLPWARDFQQGLEAVPLVVSFASQPDETSSRAHLVLPQHTFLESWGDYAPRAGVSGLLQPVMGPVFQTRPWGDILLSSGKKVRGPEQFPWKDFYQYLRSSWVRKGKELAPDLSAEEFWQQALERGGVWKETGTGGFKAAPTAFSFPGLEPAPKPDQELDLTIYPTGQFFDGRGANRPWLQELPDPLTQITWDGWLEIHPETARALDIHKGEVLRVQSSYGSLEVPAYPVYTVPRGTLALPLGQGHWHYGRFADGHPANPLLLLPPQIDPRCGGLLRPALKVSLHKRGKQISLAHVDGSFYQHGRELMAVMTWPDYQESLASGKKPPLDLPLPSGFDPRKDFYPPHPHREYRWGMVVDLDRCIGCSACVTACYAENNVAVVGKEQVLKGREMSWIRIQRYFEEQEGRARWLPMLCQHCDYAPCESVCPVYAPFHNPEGLNTQVYNRCIGTRFCLQNDPYKVRRFNWFTYSRAKPLDWQLNPEVTVRQKGVMEKCSFCIQRIVAAKQRAREEGRKVRDGEFTTACAQTCPTDTLIFGNLLDPESRVARLIQDPRRYQVLGHLNTKPAVIYLKKVRPVFETGGLPARGMKHARP
ncbi:MAG: 4Fe-4S dicluster domain-containing protein [Deltaproteobacteria bacterium]|nr:4Fe-4S dicluster domain-containing protein [Deltaproteobacteria bacterium]